MTIEKNIKYTISSLIIFIFVAIHAADNNYPVLTKIVTDDANIFTSTELTTLREKIKQFEADTTNQLAIITIKSLNGESIESYALEVFNRNKLGKKNIDNGILIVFSKYDRQVRIEVGYGLEGTLTDITSNRIIQEIMIPEFKDGEFSEGIKLATNKIIDLVRDPILLEAFNKESETPLLLILILGVFLLFFIGLISASIFIGRESLIKLYKKTTYVYKGLLTGNIGLLFFPVLLSITILQQLLVSILILAILLSIPFSYFSLIQRFPLVDLNFEYVSIALKGLMLFLFFLLPVTLAIIKIIKNKKSHFKISLTSNKEYMEKHYPSSSTSSASNDIDDDDTDDSDDDFSGGGGGSGGGGSSGSW